MKKFYYILSIALCSLQIIYSQTGWFWQNPLPQGNELYDAKFLGLERAFIVGEAGTLLSTSDFGQSWSGQNEFEGMRQGFNSVFFINNQTGWIAGGTRLYSGNDVGSRIMKTTNGGSNWFIIYSGNNLELKKVLFINTLTGWASGNNLIKTTDGGTTWVNLLSIPSQNSFFFIDENTGWLATFFGSYFYSETTIKKTTNGGANWFNQYFCGGYSGCQEMCDVYFVNHDTGFALGLANLFRTTNGGNNWQIMNITGRDIFFIDQQTGWITGGGIHKTTDCGITWVNQGNCMCFGINFVNHSSGFAVGKDGKILRTSNGGQYWESIYKNPVNRIEASCFVNRHTGWVAGEKLLKTTNSGNNWTIQSTGDISRIKNIFFLNENTGWVYHDTKIFKTTNAGSTFQFQYTTPSMLEGSILFINENIGIATYDFPNIIRTSNGGLNWNLIATTNWAIRCFAYSENTTIFAGGNSISKSTDLGLTWINVNSSPNSSVFSMTFVSENTGWASCLMGTVFKTTDGGDNWLQNYYNWGEYIYFTDIGFFNQLTGVVVGSKGMILKTTNSGSNWNLLPKMYYDEYSSFTIADDSTSWLTGVNGSILRSTNFGGNFVSLELHESKYPTSFSLHQNYPNPFNPTTKIRFDIPPSPRGEGMGVRLIVYDILGREVAVLVNEQLSPGTYEAEWDGSNFAGGVYFYKLITYEYVESRKLILIK